MEEIVIAPMILFMIVVAPIWIVMYYRSKRQSQGSLSDQDRKELDHLAAAVVAMRRRIETLESILDAETPDWRRRRADGE